MRNLASLAMLAAEVCSKRIGLALKIATRWDRVVPGIALAHFRSPLRQRVREYGIKLCGGVLLVGLNVLRVNVGVVHVVSPFRRAGMAGMGESYRQSLPHVNYRSSGN